MNTQIQLRGKELDGTDYNYVYGDGNPIQNGNELRAAVAKATLDYNTTGRIQTVLVGPGTYDMDFQPLELTSEIRIEGLSENQDSVKIVSLTQSSIPGIIVDAPNFGFNNNFNTSYKYLISQNFTFNTVTRASNTHLYGAKSNGIAKLNLNDGSYITAPLPSGYINLSTIIVDRNSDTVFLYAYSTALGYYALVRLNSNLTVDNTFTPVNLNGQSPFEIKIDSMSGSIFLIGTFQTVNGFSRNRIVKLNSNGSLDLTFNVGTGFNNAPVAIEYDQSNQRLLLSGYFNDYNGTTAQNFAVLDSSTGALSSLPGLTNNFNGVCQSIYLDTSNNTLIFSGQFTQYNNLNFNRTVRTDINGYSPTNVFLSNTSWSNKLYDSYVISNDGYIYAIGQQSSYNGTSYIQNSILKINASNGLLEDVLSIAPVPLSTSGAYFLSFDDVNGNQYLLLPYDLQASSFRAIDVSAPIPFYRFLLKNLTVNGIIVNGADLRLDNVNSIRYMDRDYYVNSISNNYYSRLTANNTSLVQSAGISGGDITLNNSIIQSLLANTFLQFSTYVNFNIYNNSSLNNALNNSKAFYVGNMNIEDSFLSNSFNGFCYTPYTSATNYLSGTINGVQAKRSLINFSFTNTMVGYNQVFSSEVNQSFYVDGTASQDERNYSFSWNIQDCNGYNSFWYRTGKNSSNPGWADNIGDISVRNCTFHQRAFSIDTVIGSVPYNRMVFSNVHLNDITGDSIYFNLKTIDDPWGGQFNWNSGVTFDNCSVVNTNTWELGSVNALSIKIDESLTTPSTLSELYLQNFSFNNCHVRTNGSLNNTLNVSVFNNQRGIYISNHNYTNCSVSTRTGSYGSFMRSLYGYAFIDISNVQFDNCTVRGSQGQNPAFLSTIESTNGFYVNFNSVSFSDCHSNSNDCFMANISCGELQLNSNIEFNDCTSGNNSFLTSITCYQWTQPTAINFKNCTAGDNSFLATGPFFTSVPMTPQFNYDKCSAGNSSFNRILAVYNIVNMKHCSAGNTSFGLSYMDFGAYLLNITGNISNCISGLDALGTQNVIFGTIICQGPTYINNCTTTGSILNLNGYNGNYNS